MIEVHLHVDDILKAQDFFILMRIKSICLRCSSKRQWAESILTYGPMMRNGFWTGLHDRFTENQWYLDEGPGVPSK